MKILLVNIVKAKLLCEALNDVAQNLPAAATAAAAATMHTPTFLQFPFYYHLTRLGKS